MAHGMRSLLRAGDRPPEPGYATKDAVAAPGSGGLSPASIDARRGLAERLRIFVAERDPDECQIRRRSNSSISGGANTRIGTPTTPIPRLTYSWLFPR